MRTRVYLYGHAGYMTISDIAVLLNNVKTSAMLGAVVSLQSYVVSRIFLHILCVLVRSMSASGDFRKRRGFNYSNSEKSLKY